MPQHPLPPLPVQVVWKASTQLGCGYAPSCRMVVCNYSPAGNVMGQFAQNVQP